MSRFPMAALAALCAWAIPGAAMAQASDWRCELATDELATLPSEMQATPASDAKAERHYRVWASRACARRRDARYFDASTEIADWYDRFADSDPAFMEELADRRIACRERAWRRWQGGDDMFRLYNSPQSLSGTCENNAVSAVVQKFINRGNRLAMKRADDAARAYDLAQADYEAERSRWARRQDDYRRDMADYRADMDAWRYRVSRCRAGDQHFCR